MVSSEAGGIKLIFAPNGTWGVALGAGAEVGTSPVSLSVGDLFCEGDFKAWPRIRHGHEVCQ